MTRAVPFVLWPLAIGAFGALHNWYAAAGGAITGLLLAVLARVHRGRP